MAEKIATRAAYGEALVALAEEYPELVVLDADLSGSTMSKKFADKYPDRFFNLGIAEANMTGVAAGLAACGKKVFTNTFDQEGWTVAGVGGGEQRMSYDDIASILEGDRYFILLEDSRRGYILDKRTFASGELERFRSLIQSKTKKTIQNV